VAKRWFHIYTREAAEKRERERVESLRLVLPPPLADVRPKRGNKISSVVIATLVDSFALLGGQQQNGSGCKKHHGSRKGALVARRKR
jgi:hypothetical protein